MHAVSVGSAAQAGVRRERFDDSECSEYIEGDESSEGTEDFCIDSCLCHKRKYCLNGDITYVKNHHQHEQGECREVTEAVECTIIRERQDFEEGDLPAIGCVKAEACPEFIDPWEEEEEDEW